MAKTKNNMAQSLTARDILFAAINGLIFGALLPVVLKNMNIAISTNKGFAIAIAFTLLAAVGVYIGYLLSKFIGVFFKSQNSARLALPTLPLTSGF